MIWADEQHPALDESKRHAGARALRRIKVRIRWLRLAIHVARGLVEQALWAEAERAQRLCRGQRIMILMTLAVGLWQGVAGFAACFVMAVTTYLLATRDLI